MKTVALALALSITFALSTTVTQAIAATAAAPVTHKVKRAKKPKMIETIRLGCPVRWEVLDVHNEKVHAYICPANHVEISVPADTEVGGAYLDGSVKGDKDAGWYR